MSEQHSLPKNGGRCKFVNIFDVWCILAAISTISYCIYEYSLDEDSTSVEFKRFDTNKHEQGYPSFTVCFLNQILKAKLESYGEQIDATHYLNSLWGYSWDPRMHEIDYDFVTMDLNKHVIFRKEWNEQFKATVYNDTNVKSADVVADRNPFYVSHRCPFAKCFSQDLPYGSEKGIAKHDIWINMDIFANKTMPPRREEVDIWDSKQLGINAFGMIFHLPNQLTRSIRLQSTAWDFETENAESYNYHVLKFTMKNMQVLKRRNKRTVPCVEGKPNDDENFYNSVMNQVGCRPSFMKSSMHLPNCSSKEHLFKYNNAIASRMVQGALDDSYTTQPCIALESLDYTFRYKGYSSKDIKDLYPGEESLAESLLNASSAIKIELNFRHKQFQLMTNDRQYNLQALIGNAGN